MSKNKLPKFCIFARVFSFILILVGIILILITACGKFKLEILMPGIMCIFFAIPLLIMGFLPNIQKTSIEIMKYTQEENKQDLKDISNNSAEISGEAITNVVKAVKNGFEDKMFCKHCGEKIDANSKFCNHCGKEQ